MLAELGDTGDKTIIGDLIEEDGIIGFLFDFSLSPFLNKRYVTLAPAFF